MKTENNCLVLSINDYALLSKEFGKELSEILEDNDSDYMVLEIIFHRDILDLDRISKFGYASGENLDKNLFIKISIELCLNNHKDEDLITLIFNIILKVLKDIVRYH